MPYASNDELPPAVRKRYSDRCQTVFRKAFNAHDGDEASKFKVAHTAGRNCMESTTGKVLRQIKAQPMDDEELAGWFDGKLPRRLLAIPFGGPINNGKAPRGVDLDGEYFSERTDLYGNLKALRQTPERLLDWQHGHDTLMSRTVIGKTILDPDPDEDGWWVDAWLKAGSKHLEMVRRLVQRGAQLFGSSEAAYKSVAEDGEITVWPMILETLTTTPTNTLSVLRPAKAITAGAIESEVDLSAGLKAVLADLDALTSQLVTDSGVGQSLGVTGRDVHDFVTAVQRFGEVVHSNPERDT